ncbi:MAG: hypothetical protein NZ518_06655, partial [Dehalococcoidia bacterium]|nr:hypothetical protein [Dehalococcoidia bacterium]
MQIFQRHVMQRRPDGGVGLLNLLDPGLMPYTTINGATLPPFDPAVASAAPTPGTAGYDQAILRFVRQHAPDTWQGQPVNFWTTFVNSVRLADAFPNGDGDASLLPALALEVWGIPTSQPAFDPNNRNFIYLRFQRGVMHYDATTGLTQGVLLADYFKSVLIGEKLPSDLDKAAKTSPHYKQYSRTAYRGLNRPDALPLTDLTNAFEPEGTTTGTQQPTTPPPSGSQNGGSAATTPPHTDSPVLSNASLRVGVQIGGAEHGRLTIRAANGELRAAAYPAVTLSNGRSLNFQKDLLPDGATFRITPVGDPALGDGRQLEVEYGLKGTAGRVKLVVTLLNDRPVVIAQVSASGLAADRSITGFRLFDSDAGGWLDIGPSATFLTSDGDLRRDTFEATRRSSEIVPGMPLLLNDGSRGRAFVLATLGSMDHAAAFTGRATTDGLAFTYEMTLPPADGRHAAASPYVYLEVTGAGDAGQVLGGFRKAIHGLYPTPKLPDWVRFQWTSTYAFTGGATESQIRQQIDLIAANFADLGPWSIVIDGDWYRADGRADADGRAVNTARFPSGMRALVDYAHLNGVRVILTVPGPYVDDTQQVGNVNGLRGLITQRRAWLTEI